MDRRLTLAAVVLVLMAAAAVCVLAMDGPDRSVVYETYGGELPEGAPAVYVPGDSLDIPDPLMDSHVFQGWFTDPGLTVPFDGVGPDSDESLHLYASWREGRVNSVGYVLNGGFLADDAPDGFTGGNGLILPVPERDGFRFGGWYLDDELTEPIVVIGPRVDEDVTVHACWVPGDGTGTGMVWNVSGKYYNGTIPHTMTGTITEEIITVRDGKTYRETVNDILYEWPTGSTVDTSRTGGWVGSVTDGLVYVGIGEACGMMCTIWSDGEDTTYWIHNLTVPVRMVLSDGETEIVHELSETYTFVPVTTFVPSVVAEHPLSVQGVGPVEIGDTVTFTAVGEEFTGWYAGGSLMSSDRTLVVDRIDPTRSYEARGAYGYAILGTGDDLGDFGFGDGAVVEDSGGNAVSSDVGELASGYYVVRGTDGPVRTYMEFFIDESRTLEFSWTYDGRQYSFSLDMLYSDVYMCTYSDAYGNIRISLSDPDYVMGYHTADDPYITAITARLMTLGQGMDRTEFAGFVLSFVQSLDYIGDQESTGRSEYWRYPLETLWIGGGDCEDTAILCDTLLMAMGYHTAFILFTDHAMTAVSVPVNGAHVQADGVTYVFCETTNDWPIGTTSVGHTASDVYWWCPLTG